MSEALLVPAMALLSPLLGRRPLHGWPGRRCVYRSIGASAASGS